jgi:hypothetical protein
MGNSGMDNGELDARGVGMKSVRPARGCSAEGVKSFV